MRLSNKYYRLAHAGTGIVIIICLFIACNNKGTADEPDNQGIGELIWQLNTDRRAVWHPFEPIIAYEHVNNAWGDKDTSGIYLIDEDGSGKRLLIPYGQSPDWSPDGNHIAFTGGGDVWIYSLVKNSFRRLTNTRKCSYPSFSSDGRYLAFSKSTDLGPPWGSRDVPIIYDLVTDSSYAITNRDSSDISGWLYLDWRPGTTEFMLQRGGEGGIWNINMLGDNLRFMSQGRFPRCSPDGKEVCFIDQETKILNLESGNSERIGIKRGASFSNDGTKIVYEKIRGDRRDPYNSKIVLRIYDRITGEDKPLTQ